MLSGRRPDKELLLEKVPEDGSAIGNVTLRGQLDWTEEKYWKNRNKLIDEEKLALGRGKGGSVRRTQATIVTEDTGEDEAPGEGTEAISQVDEQQLYDGIERVFKGQWSKELRLEQFFVQITALQGRRSTGGKWTRPDLVIVSVTTFQNLPGKFVDVTTFEVKTYEGADVTAIYEALAHLRAATRAYVFIGGASKAADHESKELDSIAAEASHHGIGLIVASDVSDYSDWKVLVEPQSNQPDPMRLDEFLETQITEENKKKLRRWVK